MKAALLEHLACPSDRGSLRLEEQSSGGSHVKRGRLVCPNGHSYEIRDGVPFMAAERGVDGEQEQTAHSFGSKWEMLLQGSYDKTIEQQYRWYEERYGFGDEAGLAEFLAGQNGILDAGCGIGYDAARYARFSPGPVIAFDLSDSVVEAQRTGGDVVDFVQGDILEPPFAPESFDLVVSDQVIHHTPDCRGAFHALAELVRPGGQIAVYVYREKAMIRELADTHVRELTTKMTVEECLDFCKEVTELGRELSELDASVTLKQGVPLLGIEPGEHDVQRLIYWTMLKCFWNEELGERKSTLGNFDWYHPQYASRHTPEEVESWCAEEGLEIVKLDVIESGISVRARKPQGTST